MRILLPAKADDLDNARAWLDDGRLLPVLDDLEAGLKSCEQQWGDCTVFVECKFPGTSSIGARQIDILIAFEDRVAQIELKQGRTIALDNTVAQINKQRRLLESYLRPMHVVMDCMHSFLWAPHVGKDQLDALVRRAWVDDHFHHITPSGGNRSLKGVTLSGGGSRATNAYLPDAIKERLQTRGSNASSNLSDALTALVNDSYARTGVDLIEFTDFQAAREYLRFEQPRWNQELIFKPTHSTGLRATEQSSALQFLLALNFVEVIAPTGFGKSTFIQELLVKLLNAEGRKYDVITCVMIRQHSAWDVLRQLARESGHLEEDRIDRLTEENLFRELAGFRLIYWIKDYDRKSQSFIRALAGNLRQHAKEHRAFWVIESMVTPESIEALGPTLAGQVKLEPLSNQALITLLKKYPHDNARRDINAIVNDAHGNPHYAIMKWTAAEADNSLPGPTRLDKYELYQAQLDSNEVFVFKSIAYLLSQSPLETTTLQLVEEYCQTLARFTQTDAHSIIRGVVEKAADWGLVSVEVFGLQSLGHEGITNALASAVTASTGIDSLLAALFPKTIHDALIGWIRVLDPHFIEHYSEALDSQDIMRWRTRLDEAFLKHPPNDLSITDVTLSLLTGHYQPFAQSSFRSSFSVIPAVNRWLRSKDRDLQLEDRTSNDAYFTNYIKWLLEHYWDHEGGVKWRLPEPDPAEPLQVLLFDTIRARGEPYRCDGKCDWEGWSKTTEWFWQKRSYDLWAEAVVRQAQTWLRPPYNNPTKAWELMQSVLCERDRLSSQAGRPLMCFHILSFLNKRKLTKLVGSLEDDAPRLVGELATQMIHDALLVENLNSIANALFFLVRSIEQRRQPKTPVEVGNYVGMLRFVERISPARRLQALLTQGSIHRHYGRSDKLEWDEYREHSDQALVVFQRVIDFGSASGMNIHVLNALSYTSEVLLRSLRFAGEEELRDWAKGNFRHALQQLEEVIRLSPVLGSELNQEGAPEESFRFGLAKARALQLWVVAIIDDASRIDDLAPAFARAVRVLQQTSRGLDRIERVRKYNPVLIDLIRTVSFTSKEIQHEEAINRCQYVFLDILDQVSRNLPADAKSRSRSSLRKDGNRLTQLLNGAGISVPARLSNMFANPVSLPSVLAQVDARPESEIGDPGS